MKRYRVKFIDNEYKVTEIDSRWYERLIMSEEVIKHEAYRGGIVSFPIKYKIYNNYWKAHAEACHRNVLLAEALTRFIKDHPETK